MKQGAGWLPAVLLVACGTVDPGPGGSGQDLSIRPATLPPAVVGFRYEEQGVILELERGAGPLTWSLPVLPAELTWLAVEPGSGRLSGVPLELVSPPAPFLVQVSNGASTTHREFSLAVGCREGTRSACGVPDPAEARCVAGSRVCLGGALGPCEPDVGRPPYEADATHCGETCTETCSRTSTNRCVGVCTCGAGSGPCADPTPSCCPGPDGRPEGFSCVSLQTPEHCGACQTACPLRPQTSPGCVSSTCRYACLDGFRNCNGGTPETEGGDADGCETRVDDDPRNCGRCGRSCPATLPASAHADPSRPPACSASACTYACAYPWQNCTGGTCRKETTEQDADGCETDFSNPATCGGNQVCPSMSNGHPTCAPSVPGGDDWRCGLACNSGFDPQPCGGVCIPLSDPGNCGACGRSCPTISTPDQQQTCRGDGQCCITTCDAQRRPPCETSCEPP